MFFAWYGAEPLHDPRTDETLASNTELEMELNSSGSFKFTIYPGHPLHGKLAKRNTKNPIVVKRDDKEIFRGDILETGDPFDTSQTVECRSAIGWLNDGIVRPYSTLKEESGNVAPSSVDGFFEWLIELFNSQVEETKRFVVGKNQGSRLDKNNHIYASNAEYSNVGAELKDKIIDTLGGYVRTRYERGIHYIDLLSDFEKVNAQEIDFGKNLLDFNKTESTDDMATFVVPIGAPMNKTKYDYSDGYTKTSDAKPVSGKEYFTPKYSKCSAMTAFASGVTYYEQKEATFATSDAKPFSGVNYYTRKYTYSKFTGTAFASGTTYYKIVYTYTKATGSMKYGTSYYVYKDGKYSKTSDKKFKSGTTYYTRTQAYKVSTDAAPNIGETYYVRNVGYTKCESLSAFASGTTYYERETYYAKTEDGSPLSGKSYYTLNRSGYTSQSDLGRFLRYQTYYEYNKANDESESKLTVGELSDERVSGDVFKQGDFVYSEKAVKEYGWIGTTVQFEDVTERENLLENGVTALRSLMSPVRTLEVTAADLSDLDPQYEPFDMGEYIRARSKPNDYDSYMLCSKIKVSFESPESNHYTLGTTFDALTGVQNARINGLNASVNKAYEAAAQISAEAKAAAQEAQRETDVLSVVETFDEYAVSDSLEEVPEDGWSSEMPELYDGAYVWRRLVTVYSNGAESVGTPAPMSGGVGASGEDATVLRIDSSRGTVFKNSEVSTVLSVAIYKGGLRITDTAALYAEFGSTAYLEWYWQRLNEDAFGVVSASDSRIGDGGFTFTLTPEDVDTKVTFMCQLITD